MQLDLGLSAKSSAPNSYFTRVLIGVFFIHLAISFAGEWPALWLNPLLFLLNAIWRLGVFWKKQQFSCFKKWLEWTK